MAKGTDFGGIHSHRDLNLIQQTVEVPPAEPKLNLIDIPGADGSKDMSTQPAGRVVFNDRVITWTFALYPGDNWFDKQREVSNALNGRRFRITLDDNPDFYFDGRIAVKEHAKDKTLRQITVEATCAPYMLKQSETVRTANLTTTELRLQLLNEFKPAVPKITVTAQTTLGWNGGVFTLAPGEHRLLDIELPAGVSTLTAKTTSGTGKITLVYREGSL